MLAHNKDINHLPEAKLQNDANIGSIKIIIIIIIIIPT